MVRFLRLRCDRSLRLTADEREEFVESDRRAVGRSGTVSRKGLDCTDRSVYKGTMPPKLVSDALLMDRLIDVFRQEGFEGASLARLQDASGLKRSSLYHRFPDGKNDMACAVVAEVTNRFSTSILSAAGTDSPLEDRIAEIGRKLVAFYDDGHLPCLLDTMSIGQPAEEVADLIQQAASAWINALAGLSREAGHSRRNAQVRATDAVAAIQGSLVIARTTDDRSAFERAIAALPERLV
jgi:TetR/AcrR family transcriptional repressor of lmrAB and yxaGH operons